jgi:hypothetical protein
MLGIISLNEKTAGHLNDLKELGFAPKIVGSEIHTEVTGFILTEVNLTTSEGKKEFVDSVRKGKVLSYVTRVTIPDGKGGKNTLFGRYLCSSIDKFDASTLFPGLVFGAKLSCLIQRKPKADKKAPKGPLSF